jgi:hypothetical protein
VAVPAALRAQVGGEAHAAWVAGELDSFSVHAPALLRAQASSLREAAVRAVLKKQQQTK